MHQRASFLFWIEILTGSMAVVICAVTLVWRDWIETIFGVDPDQHSGSLEWIIVAASAAVALTLAAFARKEWRRRSQLTTSTAADGRA